MQRKLPIVDSAFSWLKVKLKISCCTSLNVNLKTCTHNFYLSLHAQKFSFPLFSSVCATYQHLLKHCAEHVWPDDSPKVQFPAGPGVLVFTRSQDLGFLAFLSKIIHLGSIRALADVRCCLWSVCRWSARLTPGRLGAHLVVRGCLQLTCFLLNGWINVGNSFYVPLVVLLVTVSWKGGKTQPPQTRKRPTNNLDLHRNSNRPTELFLTGVYNQLLMSPSRPLTKAK